MNYRRHIENLQYFKSIVLFTLVVLLNSFSAGQAKACNYLRLQDCPIYLSCAITSTSTSNSRINKLSEFLTSEHRDLSTCNKKTKELETKIKESFRSKSLVKRKEIQLRLRNLNFYYDKIDGLYDSSLLSGYLRLWRWLQRISVVIIRTSASGLSFISPVRMPKETAGNFAWNS